MVDKNPKETEVFTDKKENIKAKIDKSTDCQSLYDNAINILTSMESNFKTTLKNIGKEEGWGLFSGEIIKSSRFDDNLDLNNPITIFEKKGAELLKKSESIVSNLNIENASVETMEMVDQNKKDLMLDELWQTREDAIQNFKDDFEDGILNSVDNVDFKGSYVSGLVLGSKIFWNKECMKKEEFESYIDQMSLPQLMLGTFNIYDGEGSLGSGAFKYCYGKLKEKLGNRNLFDYIDSQTKSGEWTQDVLKYSAFKSLFVRKQLTDLEGWINSYSGGKEPLLSYIKAQLENDEAFKNNEMIIFSLKMAFVSSIEDIENSELLGDIAKDLKDHDADVKLAYENASKVDNVDCFRDGKIEGLFIYDDLEGGGLGFFDKERKEYINNKQFSCSPKEETEKYIKYVLKKGPDSITMIQLKTKKRENGEKFDYSSVLSSIVDGKDFNLFALRGHCFTTNKMGMALGKINAVGEGDILINGGCSSATMTGQLYHAGVKGSIFAYNGEGKGDATQAFINRIIIAKNSGQSFLDVLAYYNTLKENKSSSREGYYASHVEFPNSVSAQYKNLIMKNENTRSDDLTQASEESTQDSGGVMQDLE